ncbi:MAG: GNAT family N-acetyltransferase [Hyphomicrobiaceae bacterium]
MKETEGLEQIYPRPLSGDAVMRLPPALVPTRAILMGQEIQLEPQDAAKHANELYAAGHNSDDGLKIWDYLPYGPWPDIETYKSILRQQSSSVDTIFYTLRSLKTGKSCGQTSFMDMHPQNGVIEIGNIWFAPEMQKSRSGTEALFLMLHYAMDDLGYRRMQWRCNSLNKRSRYAARRLGFRFEGIFYNHLIFKGKNRDTAWYSILDDEWPEVRSIIERWLQPSDFDDGGAPKTSLFQLMQGRGPSTRGR